MHRDELLKQLAPWREKHVRLTWKPVVSEGDGPTHVSKFSGIPWLSKGEDWPTCVGCNNPLQLFLQLNLSNLPEELNGRFGTGLLQLFYCVDYNCDAALGAWQPFSGPTILRIVQPARPERENVTAHPGHFPPRTIIGWDIDADFPAPEERAELGLKYEYNIKEKRVNISWLEAGLQFANVDFDTAHAVSEPQSGDKLSGWPYWVQGVEYQNCPQCGQRMDFVFQIDSEKNLPFMFGDVGCGHITQCPTHRDVVAFGWACC
jgi:uncharacterized protein YwqG